LNKLSLKIVTNNIRGLYLIPTSLSSFGRKIGITMMRATRCFSASTYSLNERDDLVKRIEDLEERFNDVDRDLDGLPETIEERGV
jgi:hypothetical protein